MGSIQGCSYYGNMYPQVSDSASVGLLGFENYHKEEVEEGERAEKIGGSSKSFIMNQRPLHSDPSEINSSELVLGAANSSLGESLSVLNFKSGVDHWIYSSGSVLSFDQREQVGHPKIGHEDNYSIWADDQTHFNNPNSKWNLESRLIGDVNTYQTASGYGQMKSWDSIDWHGEEQEEWIYDSLEESKGLDGYDLKRPHTGGDVQPAKRQCISSSRQPKPKPLPSKDPQSIAAKNRRERISERLKILQDLVPNGTKVDLVTMLEKAISYVKFLQLQVRVLATEEFWPAQGGNAPEVAQVKEAIDAILSSHRDINSSSK